ncbi:MAG: phosphatase PAP2 family protein [Chloroflexi bacterium]|nr:phosphatase PAP2 family protein [Chloroflexota bacterium]
MGTRHAWRVDVSNGLVDQNQASDPTLARTDAAGWRAYLRQLSRGGRSRLAALGITLVLGYLLGLGALLFFSYVAFEVRGRQTQALDESVLAFLRGFQSPALDTLASAISVLGSEAVAGFLVLLLLVLGWRRQWGAAVALVLVVVGAQELNNVLKDFFQRARPAPVAGAFAAQAFSFPSGHAMVAASFYTFIGYLGWRELTHQPVMKRVWVGLMTLVVLLIGLSRLYLGVHYFTDVLAGYAAGLIWTDAVILGSRMVTSRRLARATREHPAAMLSG